MRRLLILISLFFSVLRVTAVKRALLVGIGDYPNNSGWTFINADNDISLLKEKLSNDFIVYSLKDSQATCHNIKSALSELILKSDVGDTILIHFSCHGQQMLTKGKDEPDYLDEALIPYDAQIAASKKYHGENHLKDNELGDIISSLRKKLGRKGLVIITIDACFSDSMNKGVKKSSDVIYRGTADIFGENLISKDSLKNVLRRRKEIDTQNCMRLPNAANVVFFSACKSFQLNREVKINGKGYGSLSYAMASAFDKVKFGNLTSWLDCVYKTMREKAYFQTPKIRTTLNYQFPKSKVKTTPIQENNHDGFRHEILLGALVLTIIIGLLIWKKKK